MKRIFLFFTALFIGMAAAQSAKAQLCPSDWNPVTQSSEILVFGGCIYECIFCYGIDALGYHCISLTSINVMYPCTGADFEADSKNIVNAILIQIAQRQDILSFLEVQNIPECPNNICLLRLYDAFCYNGWWLNPNTRYYEMQKCDNEIRSCNEVIRICWTLINGQQVIQVDRIGTPQGAECKSPCKTNCG
jgi:hypothetical protein